MSDKIRGMPEWTDLDMTTGAGEATAEGPDPPTVMADEFHQHGGPFAVGSLTSAGAGTRVVSECSAKAGTKEIQRSLPFGTVKTATDSHVE